MNGDKYKLQGKSAKYGFVVALVKIDTWFTKLILGVLNVETSIGHILFILEKNVVLDCDTVSKV